MQATSDKFVPESIVFHRATGPFLSQPGATPQEKVITCTRAERPFHWLVPDKSFLILDSIFGEKGQVFFLKGVHTMMLLLIVNIATQVVKVGRSYGKSTVPALP